MSNVIYSLDEDKKPISLGFIGFVTRDALVLTPEPDVLVNTVKKTVAHQINIGLKTHHNLDADYTVDDLDWEYYEREDGSVEIKGTAPWPEVSA